MIKYCDFATRALAILALRDKVVDVGLVREDDMSFVIVKPELKDKVFRKTWLKLVAHTNGFPTFVRTDFQHGGVYRQLALVDEIENVGIE